MVQSTQEVREISYSLPVQRHAARDTSMYLAAQSKTMLKGYLAVDDVQSTPVVAVVVPR